MLSCGSVALVVDDPQMYHRIRKSIYTQATIRFFILLWGDKSSITDEVADGKPIYTYQEVVDLGRESRTVLLHSEDASKLPSLCSSV